MDMLASKASFAAEARWQRFCQNPNCPKPGFPHQAHHVVFEQHIRRVAPALIYDVRNSMRLCRGCHGQFHKGRITIPCRAIRDETIEFAVEIMGRGKAFNYFERHYADADKDQRLTALADHTEAA